MADPLDSVDEKVLAIFQEFFGERADRLNGSVISQQARNIVNKAMTSRYGPEQASKIALHITDWNWDAAFIVALHLFPERFTSDEINAGVGIFLNHAPNHIRAACQVTGQYVWENFPDDDED